MIRGQKSESREADPQRAEFKLAEWHDVVELYQGMRFDHRLGSMLWVPGSGFFCTTKKNQIELKKVASTPLSLTTKITVTIE